MNVNEFYGLNASAQDEIFEDTPTTTATGERIEPYRYMTYKELCTADHEIVRGYVEYIRREYGVSNTELAATLGKPRPNVIKVLNRAGVPVMDSQTGCNLAARFDRFRWARFVTGESSGDTLKETVCDRTAEAVDPTPEPAAAPAPAAQIGTITMTGNNNSIFQQLVAAAVRELGPGEIHVTITLQGREAK